MDAEVDTLYLIATKLNIYIGEEDSNLFCCHNLYGQDHIKK